jgi:predicted enzyme related to lactoylglutathione lyase
VAVQGSLRDRSGVGGEPSSTREEAAVAHAGIAKLWKPVVNVTDLDKGESFWSAVSGLSPRGRHGQFSVLDADDASEGAAWILLQLVPEGQTSVHAGTHLDFRVEDVAGAARQIEEIGGVVVKPAGMYELDGQPVLEWAVMQDPFGNEFCIIRWPLH